ncbi:phage tail assembly protein [Dickeya lacustris]|uniref:Phage tail assembly protein n=1 Tax=Dickeya lacustris TaxID=2259638 RepID=A0ABY8G8U3_9GAMM|nr:phage tail assembly protein [Dickeya lacustris]WFN56382.1 phage tail assembly protein [Dickeya lacustris]
MTVAMTGQEHVITLSTPIKRGETLIETISVIKPTAGTLRGIALADLTNADVDALIKLLPRMTYPSLTEADVTALDLSDLLLFAGKVIGFLTPSSAR